MYSPEITAYKPVNERIQFMTRDNTQVPSYKDATGKIPYGLTNDYMFHAVLQKNVVALKGLIASVLHLNLHSAPFSWRHK